MSILSKIRRYFDLPFTDQEYQEALIENAIRQNSKMREELNETNERSINVAENVRRRVARRKLELDDVFRHLDVARQSAENASDLLKKIVEGPS